MKNKVILSGKELNYYLRKYKLAKNIRLSIGPCFEDEMECLKETGLKILITAPKRVSESLIEKFMKEKSAWIFDKIQEMKGAQSSLGNGTNYKKEKEKARKIIVSRVDYFGELYGFEFGRIAIRSQRTRWGSCSKDGNLNFNYKLIYLPQEMMDYVIVHELCHLDQFNHSKRFWFLVSEIIPDYLILRRKLKKISI